MADPKWLLGPVVEAIHAAQLAEHGGGPGLRDRGLLDAALARPQQLFSYGQPDLPDLAAAYAYALVRNHPFVDGNKRTAFLAAYVFLRINGQVLTAPEAETVLQVLALAAGDIEEAAFADWLRAHIRPPLTSR